MVKRTLVVDDDSDICFVLEIFLRENGFVVDTYEDPFLALRNFKAYSYDLVILDVKMPKLNGFALYREIKRIKRLRFVFLRQVKCITVIQIYSLQYLPIILFENPLITKNY